MVNAKNLESSLWLTGRLLEVAFQIASKFEIARGRNCTSKQGEVQEGLISL
jgi:hypothetical protein